MMNTERKPVGRQKDPERRKRILGAARGLFLKHGFDATSVEAIAREAGVSKVTVYGHFGTRDAVLEAVVKEEADSINAALVLETDESGSLSQRLTSLGVHIMALLRERHTHEFERLIAERAAQHPKLVAVYYDSGPSRAVELATDMLRPQIGENAQEAAEMLFALWGGGEQHRVALKLRPQMTEQEAAKHVSRCVGVIIRAYRPDTDENLTNASSRT